AGLMRFLLRWQRVSRGSQLIGAEGLLRIVEQLQGFETAAGAWERELLPSRLHGYDPSWLDQMCLAGHLVWCRLSPRKVEALEEPLAPDEQSELLAALTHVASTPGDLDQLPPELRPAVIAGEQAALAVLAPRAPATLAMRGDAPLLAQPPSIASKRFPARRHDPTAARRPAPAKRAHVETPAQTAARRAALAHALANADATLKDAAVSALIETIIANASGITLPAANVAGIAGANGTGVTRNQIALAITVALAASFELPAFLIATTAIDAAFPATPQRRNAPSRSAPLALMLRRDAAWLRAAAASSQSPEPPALSALATRLRDHLATAGASFLADLVTAMDCAPDAVEDALWELVGAGLATADGFASLRVLVDRRRGEVKSHFDRATPPPTVRKWQDAIRRARTRDRERPGHALRALPTAAGRWSLLPALGAAPDAEASARQLLLRYGVVFRDLLAREAGLPPWRDLLVALRRLEARGEIRGGRFVTGFVGEQFALPEALDELRAVRHSSPNPDVCRIAATDPLNLVGVLSPGPRVPATLGNAVLYVDGQPVASLEAGELVMRAAIPPGAHVDADLTYHPPPRPAIAATQAALPL
ncbi:MAG: hypothetical protein JO257_16420, partial [Deltaproteobacteria bacterium]|nr:hypothetical protein [Deltaproteobacteria bacterium]